MREQAVLHAGQKHHGKFQPLGGMQSHHLHAIVIGIRLAFAGFQHRMREEGLERLHVGFGLVSGEKPRAALTSSSKFSTRPSPRSPLPS